MRLAYGNGAEFYDVTVCQHSKKGENSPYKCRNTDCPHHYCHTPGGFIEYYEWNPFGKNVEKKCPYYQSKAQMIVQNKRRYENERQYL